MRFMQCSAFKHLVLTAHDMPYYFLSRVWKSTALAHYHQHSCVHNNPHKLLVNAAHKSSVLFFLGFGIALSWTVWTELFCSASAPWQLWNYNMCSRSHDMWLFPDLELLYKEILSCFPVTSCLLSYFCSVWLFYEMPPTYKHCSNSVSLVALMTSTYAVCSTWQYHANFY